jgi:signal transduction histidine kinase
MVKEQYFHLACQSTTRLSQRGNIFNINIITKFTTNPHAGGTGLGLYISKNIVVTHGGKIWADNNVSGKGATFAFTLHA